MGYLIPPALLLVYFSAPVADVLAEAVVWSCLGMIATARLITLATVAAGLVAAAFRFWHGTNVLAGATQVACYLSVCFPIWVAVFLGPAAIAIIVGADDWVSGWLWIGIPPLPRELGVVFGPNLAFACLYTLLVARGVHPLQYANH